MIALETRGIDQLKKALGDQIDRLPKELAMAVNATAGATKRQMAKEVTKELAVPQKVVTSKLSQPRKATRLETRAVVRMDKSRRISLREFGAKQNRSGVSYRISKSKGRKTVAGAFQGPKPGAISAKTRGNVFKRVGKSRLPIVKLNGPSPWGVFVKSGATDRVVKFAEDELEKQTKRRVNTVMVRRGLI